MKLKNFIFYFFLFLCFSGLQCPKGKDNNTPSNQEPTTLPPITTVGANTFGCYVDGKLWVSSNRVKGSSLNGDYKSGYIYINTAINNGHDPYTGFQICIYKGVVKPNTYDIKFRDLSEGWAKYTYQNTFDIDSSKYFADTVYIGTLILLNLDSIHKNISGTFQFEAFNKYRNKVVRITDGRFDIHYAN